MKRYSANEIHNLILRYSIILSLVIFVISFFMIMPNKPSQAVLENYNTLATQIMNEGVFAQKFDYSALDVDSEDMYIKIHQEKDDVYSISIETPDVIVNVNYQEGKILNVSHTYWTLYLLAVIISLSISFLSFIFLFFVIGLFLFSFNRKNS